MVEKPVLHLEELNLKYETEKPAKHGYRARVPGGLNGVTFYPDPNHGWDGRTQEA